MNILSFQDDLTEEVFHGIHTHAVRKKFTPELLIAAERKLDILNATDSLESLTKIPDHRAENNVRDVHGKHSIPIDDKCRILFRFNDDGIADVEIKF